MKRLLSRAIPAILAAALLAGCGGNTTPPATDTPNDTGQPPAQETGSAKTGLAITTSLGKSADVSADKAGLVQADSIIVGVIVDDEGRILDCAIDSAQTKVEFDSAGQITTPLDAEIQTKNELGTDYGMGKASGIGKEWSEQAAALADYVTGKTVDEIQGIAVNEEGRASDADLSASVTISISGYIDAIAEAAQNAEELGAGASDEISLGTTTSIGRSKNAGEENGEVEVYSTYTAVTTDDSGKITSCVIDSTQAKAEFDSAGKLTSDLNAAVQTKNQIGEGYGLKGNSGIGKEWYEQAAAFANYVVGKTAAEVQAIAVNEDEVPTDADLTASVTIGIADFQTIIAKAAR